MRKPLLLSAKHDTNGQPESWSSLAGSHAGSIVKKQHRRRALAHQTMARNRQLPPTVVAACTMGAMLDLAPKQPGPTSPCVLPRHPLVAIREPKAELAVTVDFHLDRCSKRLFKSFAR